MAEYEKKVRKVLKDHDCYFLRHGKGDHDIWVNPANGHSTAVDSVIRSRYTANAIMKELGISYHF